jgi:hypothetical protein
MMNKAPKELIPSDQPPHPFVDESEKGTNDRCDRCGEPYAAACHWRSV